jgi:hypothetical protein
MASPEVELHRREAALAPLVACTHAHVVEFLLHVLLLLDQLGDTLLQRVDSLLILSIALLCFLQLCL